VLTTYHLLLYSLLTTHLGRGRREGAHVVLRARRRTAAHKARVAQHAAQRDARLGRHIGLHGGAHRVAGLKTRVAAG